MKFGVRDLHTMLLTAMSFTTIGAGKALPYVLNAVTLLLCCESVWCGVSTGEEPLLV